VKKCHKIWIKKRGISYAEMKGGFNGEKSRNGRKKRTGHKAMENPINYTKGLIS
jgi:hypothetical protein